MKAFATILTFAATVIVVNLFAATASACGGYNKYGSVGHAKKNYSNSSYARSRYVAPVSVASAAPSAEATLPSVAAGSVLTLGGRDIGAERGSARLIVVGLALPIDILEWNNTSTRIELPKLELATPMKAEIKITRADGVLVSTTVVLLTPALPTVAAAN